MRELNSVSEIFLKEGTLDQFDVMGFFINKEQVQPSVIEFGDHHGNFNIKSLQTLLEFTLKNKVVEFRNYFDEFDSSNPYNISISYKTPSGKTALLCLHSVVEYEGKQFVQTKEEKTIKTTTSGASFFYHPEEDQKFLDSIFKAFQESQLTYCGVPLVEDTAYLTMILFNPMRGGFYTKRFSMNKWVYNDEDLTLQYGEDMKEFHETLIKTFERESKGITLFHGDPGTGKTHYIRRITKDLCNLGKEVLFIPNNIFDKIGDPAFNEFMINNFLSEDDSDPGIVFILEDAEKILMKNANGRTEQVSTLLNLGDGIMNDLFKIQLVCTFNCEETEIDEAILRDGRLLAKRFFGKLNIKDSQKMINKLNIDFKATGPMTIANIFALQNAKDKSILVQNKEVKTKEIQLNS